MKRNQTSKQPVSFVRQCAFLFLAFAVFTLGLHARLSLYKASAPLSVTSAKVATETRSAQVLKSIAVRPETPPAPDELPAALRLVGFEPVLRMPGRVEQSTLLSIAPSRMQASAGPPLRRPPPAVL